MDLYNLLELCKAYRDLGDAITRQLDDILEEEEPLDKQNPSALRYLERFLEGAAKAGVEDTRELADSIQAFLASQER